jgi:ribosome assembly protein 4
LPDISIPQDEPMPYSFFLGEDEILETLNAVLDASKHANTEDVLSIIYQPQAIFRVRTITHCSSSLPGSLLG